MKQPVESRTDWERVSREYEADAPIPFDDEDRREGLYDPNDEEAVKQAWMDGVVTRGMHKPRAAEPGRTAQSLSKGA